MSDIQDKIKKLLALATNNPNEHEAAAALRLAHHLMEKHAISEAQVRGMPTGTIDAETVPIATAAWRVTLFGGIAQSHGCYSYYTPGRCVTVVGRPEQRRMVVAEFWELCGMIDRFASRHRGRGVGRAWIASYRAGIAAKLREEMLAAQRAARDEARREGASTMALVVVDQSRDEAKRWAHERVTLRNSGRKRISHSDGYSAGLRDGAGMYGAAARRKVDGSSRKLIGG